MYGYAVVVGIRRRLGDVAPVPFRAKIGEPQTRIENRRRVVPAACFEQENALAAAVGGQSADQGAGRAARAAHDIIVASRQRLGLRRLIGLDLVQRLRNRLDPARREHAQRQ